MSKKVQHVVPHNKQWVVKGVGNQKYTHIVDTQKEAIELAKGIAKNQKSELIVHKKDGSIGYRNSYGNDPKNIPG